MTRLSWSRVRVIAIAIAALLVGSCARLQEWWCGQPAPAPSTAAAPDPRYDAEVAGLQDEIARLGQALREDPCSDKSRELVPDPLDVPGSPPGEPPYRPAPATIAALLERATVLVLAANGTRASGFFVSPTHVLTRVPPAAGGDGDGILVVSASERPPARAKVVQRAAASDLALLELADRGVAGVALVGGPVPAARTQILAAAVAGDLDYAAAARAHDAGERLPAAFTVQLTQGEVGMRLSGASGTAELIHTAALARDGGGGPVVDACGRVFGINVRTDTESARTVRYAGVLNDARALLAAASATTSDAPCEPNRKVAAPEETRPPERMEIPADAAQKGDLGFLQGHWRVYNRHDDGTFHPDLAVEVEGKLLKGVTSREDYTFDAHGSGRRHIVLSDGRSCESEARASLGNGRLEIEAGAMTCPNLRWVAAQIACEAAPDGEPAKCKELQADLPPVEIWVVKVKDGA